MTAAEQYKSKCIRQSPHAEEVVRMRMRNIRVIFDRVTVSLELFVSNKT